MELNFDAWFPVIPGFIQTNKDTDPRDFQWLYYNKTTRIRIDYVSTNQTPNYAEQNFTLQLPPSVT